MNFVPSENRVSVKRLAKFFRDRKTGHEVPSTLHGALEKFKTGLENLYRYDDVEKLFKQFGQDIHGYEVNPYKFQREKFEVTKYESKFPLWSLGSCVEDSEEEVVRTYVMRSVQMQLLQKHFFALLFISFLFLVMNAPISV